MIGLIFDDGVCPVKLFHENQADELMWKRHFGERYFFVGAPPHLFRKSVWASDDEDKPFGSMLFLDQPFGELDASVFRPVLIEQDDGVAGVQAV